MKKVYRGAANKGGVYKILNVRNGRTYFGSTVSFKIRVGQHLSSLRNNKHSNKYLQADFNKCGKEAFEYHVVEVVEGDKDARLLAEQKYLDKHYDNQTTCYNFMKEARSPEGTFPKDSKERKRKRSEAFKKTWAENKEQMCASLVERWQNPDFRNKIVAAQKRATKTQLGKTKMRKALKAANKVRAKNFHLVSPEGVVYKGQNIAAFCRKHSLDFRQISDVVKGRRRTANGWKTFSNREPKYQLMSPNGQIIGFDFQKKFAEEHKLSYWQVWKLCHGKIESHKGWRLK